MGLLYAKMQQYFGSSSLTSERLVITAHSGLLYPHVIHLQGTSVRFFSFFSLEVSYMTYKHSGFLVHISVTFLEGPLSPIPYFSKISNIRCFH